MTAHDYRASGGRLPGYARANDALRAALPALNPVERITVAEAAARYRRVRDSGNWTDWRNSVAPYMTEPGDLITSRRFSAVVFVGPARSAKTEVLINNAIVHAIMCQPRLAHLTHIDKNSAQAYSEEKLEPLLNNSPLLGERRMSGRSADNIFSKRFSGGARVTIGWPVVSQLSARDIPLVLFSDYDRMPDDIGGEGSPFSLGRKRTQTFGTRGMTVAEASPGRPILDESWSPRTPHEAPPTTGILSLYNIGTRGRFYWRCRDCLSDFEPRFERLHYEKGLTPTEAGLSTVMVCPECGSVIEPSRKSELNASGQWLHEGKDGDLVPITGALRPTDVASFWLMGAAAAFAPWREIVTRYLEAVATFESTGDEAALKTTTNVDQGLPYLPRAMTSDAEVSAQALREKSQGNGLTAGVAPAWARFVTLAVDVQANRFVVQVHAYGEGLERVLIDRFDLHEPPADAPRASSRAINPGRYMEDWQALVSLKSRAYRVAGTPFELRPVALTVDSGGGPGVTTNAYRFWRSRRKIGDHAFFSLVKGVGGVDRPRAMKRYPESASRGRRVARDVPIIFAGTDPLKDAVIAALGREERGPGAFHIAAGVASEIFDEFAAERRGPKGWEKKPGQKRNEALDLAVYDLARVIVLKGEKIDWTRPPEWAAPLERNSFARAVEVDCADGAPPESSKPRPTEHTADTSKSADPSAPAASVARAIRQRRRRKSRDW